jgi:hypothetical protein
MRDFKSLVRRDWKWFLAFVAVWYVALVVGNCLADPTHGTDRPRQRAGPRSLLPC